MFFRKNKVEEERTHNLRAHLASKSADIHIDMLIPEVKETIENYLRAIFEVNPDHLPMNKMSADIYNHIGYNILNESKEGIVRTISHLEILSILPADYENEFTYVSKICYEVRYHINGVQTSPTGTCPYSFDQEALYIFSYDQRLGWILSSCIKDAPAKADF